MTSDPGKPRGRPALDALETLCIAASGVAFAGVIGAQGWQVFSRYVLNSPPSWTDPLAVTLMAFAAMLGAAVGVRRGTHFAFTSLGDALPKPLPALCRALAQASLLVSGLALVVLGAQLAAADWSVKMAGAPLSAGLKFVPLCLGGALIALFAIEKLALSASRSEPRS